MTAAISNRFHVDACLYQLAENLSFTACSNPAVLCGSLGANKGTIHDKLLQIFLKQFSPNKLSKVTTSSRACSNLLSLLVTQDNLNTLVINLKPLDQGYSVCLKTAGGGLVETVNLPYTDKELLNFIEQEEIPHNLVDLLEQAQPELFYDGCIIAEIRDGRRAVNGAYKTSYILLKPSHRSLLADINSLTSDQFRWSQDDRFTLESKLLLATNEPLCLDPSPAVGIIHNRLAFKKRAAQAQILKRAMKPYTAEGILKQRTRARLSCHKELPVFSFLRSRANKSKYPKRRESYTKPVVDNWKSSEPELSPINASDVSKLAKTLEKPNAYPPGSNKVTVDCTPSVVEEYTLETERPQGKLHRTRLVIMKRATEDKYLGELYIDRSEWTTNKCCFELGTAPLKDKYIQQFIEIFTEEGRKQVKIIHTLPGQTSQTMYTSGQQSIQQLQAASANAAAQSQVQQSNQLQSRGGATVAVSSQSPVRFSADNQSSIRFSLTSQPGALSTLQPQQGTEDAANSMSSNESSGASLMLGRQGLKLQGPILPSPQTPQPADQQTLAKDQIGAVSAQKAVLQNVSKLPTVAGGGGALGKPTLLMSRTGTPTQITQIGGVSSHNTGGSASTPQLIGISSSASSTTNTISLHNLAGLQGLQNVQVSLTNLGQSGSGSGIAVPVTLIGGMSGSQPIFLSGPLNMMDNSQSNQQSTLSQSGSSAVATPRSIVVTTQAGGNQQIIGGHQGLITLPVGSALAQQILAANKQRQNQQQQLNVVNAQQITNNQTPQIFTSTAPTPQQISQKPASIQLLTNQQGQIQIGHIAPNQQTSNIQIGHQILSTGNTGNIQVRTSQTGPQRSSSMHVFHQSNLVQHQHTGGQQLTPQHINIITSGGAGGSGSGGQVFHIPQNISIAHIGQAGAAQQQTQQLRQQGVSVSAANQQQLQALQQKQKLFKQLSSPPNNPGGPT